jgi:tetratricopeptide (TPR) repeat protein
MGKTLLTMFVTVLLADAGSGDLEQRKVRAHAAFVAGRYAEAEAGYRALLGHCGPEMSLSCAAVTENLGVVLRARGRIAEARPLMEAGSARIAELAGADSPEAAAARTNLAALYWSTGEHAEASQISRTLLESAAGPTAVTLYGNLSAAAIGMGQMDQAAEYARQGLDLARRVLPANDPRRAAVLNNLAQAYRFTGRFQEAEPLYREALAIWERALGDAHPDLGRGMMNLAAFYHERGREAGAEQLYLRAVAILEKADAALALVARNELADVLRAQLRYTEAKKLAHTTLTRMESDLPAGDVRLVRARSNWARLVAETSRVASTRR